MSLGERTDAKNLDIFLVAHTAGDMPGESSVYGLPHLAYSILLASAFMEQTRACLEYSLFAGASFCYSLIKHFSSLASRLARGQDDARETISSITRLLVRK